jgi:hypothetical protein
MVSKPLEYPLARVGLMSFSLSYSNQGIGLTTTTNEHTASLCGPY